MIQLLFNLGSALIPSLSFPFVSDSACLLHWQTHTLSALAADGDRLHCYTSLCHYPFSLKLFPFSFSFFHPMLHYCSSCLMPECE